MNLFLIKTFCWLLLSHRKIFNDLSGSESPTKVETISEDIQGQSDGTEGNSPIAVITTSALTYQQAPQTVTIPGTIQIVTSGEALQAVPMAQNSSGTVVQYQQQQQVKLAFMVLLQEKMPMNVLFWLPSRTWFCNSMPLDQVETFSKPLFFVYSGT